MSTLPKMYTCDNPDYCMVCSSCTAERCSVCTVGGHGASDYMPIDMDEIMKEGHMFNYKPNKDAKGNGADTPN